ncbi:MAG: thioredoxin domain-containing protein [Lysobacterales bacterium]|jgi:hypothetical protein
MNRLSGCSSLYLHQHADNPVHWQPWDEQALADARSRNAPILLSIGYSACHWCHVMAHESFEDPAIARVMNALFVNIKVDREERPDLDKIYQLSHQLLTGRGGGWPLTVFLEPAELIPFFAGTYFPPEARQGMPAFPDVLRNLRQWYDTHQQEIARQGASLRQAVGAMQDVDQEPTEPGDGILHTAAAAVLRQHDRQHGGFGGAPKFPQAPLLSFVNSLCAHRDADGTLAAVLHHSLGKMAGSGLRDHLDGGFFRYTVDGRWCIPHFEKMLYDNAQLLPLYAESSARLAKQGLPDAGFAAIAGGIVRWLDGSMAADEGGYCASIDADAGGVEGGFHVWDAGEVEQLLGQNAYRLFSRAYGLDQPPNFEGRAWHLLRRVDDDELATEMKLGADEIAASLQQSARLLARHREKRVHPTTDPKRLTGWNALAVDGLARAGAAMRRPEWIDKAVAVLDSLQQQMWSGGELYTVHAAGHSHTAAYLDDYAWLLQSVLTVLQQRWRDRHYRFALQLADAITERFEDREHGGFFYTPADRQTPLHRIRPLQDDATPGASGCAALALLEIGHLRGDPACLETARRALRASATQIRKYPLAHASLLMALDEYHLQPPQVVIIGSDAGKIAEMHAALQPMDKVHCYAIGPAETELPGALGTIDERAGVAAFVCHAGRCLPPAGSLETALEQLRKVQTSHG